MIRVEHLTKYYGDALAVDDLSFEVGEGEIVGLLGPNGAGKSMTLRILTGYLAATAGDASVAGHDVFAESLAARRSIGYLPENVPLYEEMRVREYLGFRGRLKEIPRAKLPLRIAEAMDRVGIADVSRKLIGHLSKGYRQRVGIAAALLHKPPVLILDEPTVGLDPTQIRSTRHFIRELGGEHTLLLSSHILPEVESVCDRILILHRGKLVAMDTPTRLKQKLEGGSNLLAEVRGDAKAIRSKLDAIEGVDQVEVETRGEVLRIRIRAQDGLDVREPVSSAIVATGGVLREFRPHHVSLEEVFVRITTEESANDGSAEGPR